MKKTRFRVLSPDGFTIHMNPETYSSREIAENALTEWMKRYERQGYYSSNDGRIPLDKLRGECEIIEA